MVMGVCLNVISELVLGIVRVEQAQDCSGAAAGRGLGRSGLRGVWVEFRTNHRRCCARSPRAREIWFARFSRKGVQNKCMIKP
jgi:hypothetical protein